MTNKEIALANSSGRGGGGRGRGSRGREGGGRFAAAQGGGRGRGDHRRPTAAAAATGGGRGGNHGRHPRQPAKSPNDKQHQSKNNKGGRGRGNARSSSYHDKREEYTPKKSGPYAHLFCSERHAFALSRVFYPRNNDYFLLPLECQEGNGNNRRIASDAQLEQWWDSVKIVRCHVPFNESTDTNSSNESNRLSFQERCPICLDEDMVSPFIAPCGHTYCLPCVLGYLNSVAKDLNEESDRLNKTKQNVKGGTRVVGSPCSKNRASVTSVRARCPMCSSGSSMELNAGEPVLAYKDLRPVAFVPTLAIRAASVGESKGGKGKKSDNLNGKSHQRGTRMKFVKLHRVKSCPSPYLPLNGNCVRGALTSPLTLSDLPDLPDGDDNAEECIYARLYSGGLKEYENTLQRNLDDLNSYREETVHCQIDPREDWNVSMAVEAIKAAQRRWLGSGGDSGGFRGMELDAKSDHIINKTEQRLVGGTSAGEDNARTDEEAKPMAPSHKNSALLHPGSFHLHHLDSIPSQGDPDEFLYYQSSDGQPCFLSGINVACLMNEFSLHQKEEDNAAGETNSDDANQEKVALPPEQRKQAPNQPRNTLPLPDEITGTVLEIEQMTVTPSLIKRKPFLSHIPLNSFVSFVEIDWYSGGEGMNRPMLSHITLSKFRGELQRRKSGRLRDAKQEQKADKVARAKSEKDEHRRRRELLGAHYLDGGTTQTIDPEDEFFRALAASVDESEDVVQRNRSASFQFNEVCAAGGAWPELLTQSNHGYQETAATSFPSLQSSPAAAFAPSSPPQTNTSWGRSRKPSAPAKPAVSNFPSLSESSSSGQKSQRKGRATSIDLPWGSR